MNTNFDYRGFLFSAACIGIVVFGIHTAGRAGETLAAIFPDTSVLSFSKTGQASSGATR